MNTDARRSLPDWLPLAVGGLFVMLFAGLGAWQVSRGLEKRAEQDLFADASGFSNWSDGMDVRPYQPLRVTGTPVPERQFLLDNIIVDSRVGYYVLTPFETTADEPLLLVNRGWIEKRGDAVDTDLIALPANRSTVRGRAGSLPRAGFRMGDPILAGEPWPKRAVYPVSGDLEQELGRAVQPFVLLLDPDDDFGFVRRWEPAQLGPGRHFGYALQWFAMGMVLAALLVWNYRKRRFSGD